jgi:hypothetical protein
VRVRGTIARQKKLPLRVSWLVRKMRSHGWRLIFSLGFKFNKPVAKINYRVLIYSFLLEMLDGKKTCHPKLLGYPFCNYIALDRSN